MGEYLRDKRERGENDKNCNVSYEGEEVPTWMFKQGFFYDCVFAWLSK